VTPNQLAIVNLIKLEKVNITDYIEFAVDALATSRLYCAADLGAPAIMEEIRIRVLRHHDTGLLMALSSDLPGFVVHAHSLDEMAGKLQGACESFMRAIGRGNQAVAVVPEDVPPGFEPDAFIARVERRAAA
jgi:hypothetical protein